MPTQNSAGTSFTVSSGRQLTQPLQPAFNAYLSAAASNVTGAGTLYGPIVFDTEIFDQNADYDNGTGTLTAPITGKYCLIVKTLVDQLAATNTSGNIILTTSNCTYTQAYINWGFCRDVNDEYGCNYSFEVDMDVGDTATVSIQVNAGAADTVDILSANMSTCFCGYLMG